MSNPNVQKEIFELIDAIYFSDICNNNNNSKIKMLNESEEKEAIEVKMPATESEDCCIFVEYVLEVTFYSHLLKKFFINLTFNYNKNKYRD